MEDEKKHMKGKFYCTYTEESLQKKARVGLFQYDISFNKLFSRVKPLKDGHPEMRTLPLIRNTMHGPSYIEN